ncbi:hypothetical protein [Streptomyces sp. NPDC093149]|uniref:hypothetical protein n=1 Tax=Streptomyces sp. NPDC093149 TaxID=3366031 RepID=UPI003816ECCE
MPSINGERRPRARRGLLPGHRAGRCESVVPGPEHREETLTPNGGSVLVEVAQPVGQ